MVHGNSLLLKKFKELSQTNENAPKKVSVSKNVLPQTIKKNAEKTETTDA